MPKGDPAGYLPNVKAARKGGKMKGKEKAMKGKNPFMAAMHDKMMKK